jgi:hypothetical protein
MTYLDDLQMIKSALFEIIKQANGLAIGLQHIAPPQVGMPSSVRYLFETAEQLQEKLTKINQLIEEKTAE